MLAYGTACPLPIAHCHIQSDFNVGRQSDIAKNADNVHNLNFCDDTKSA